MKYEIWNFIEAGRCKFVPDGGFLKCSTDKKVTTGLDISNPELSKVRLSLATDNDIQIVEQKPP